MEAVLKTPSSEMVAVIGRRRVGKTFLVKQVYSGRITLGLVGVKNAPLVEQLSNFVFELQRQGLVQERPPRIASWTDAFQLLIQLLEAQTSKGEQKPVLFFDELPWLASNHSGFLRGLSYFWNSWAVDHPVVVVICGSAASWMIKRVIQDTGGLHNRVTKRIYLSPFTLVEAEEFLRENNVVLNRYHTVQLYMAMGGIPHYLKEIRPGWSAAQNIDAICFSANGLLRDEFTKLYTALFDESDKHLAVVRALGSRTTGVTRAELTAAAHIPEGGTTQRVLEELEQSSFITAYQPWGKKKKDRLYRLTDEFTLFYLRFMDGKTFQGDAVWESFSQTQSYKVWTGYAFENVCLKHIPQIKKALGISGIYTEAASYYHKQTPEVAGVQIDLLLDRNDNVIHLFESKFYNTIYHPTAAQLHDLRGKVARFQAHSRTRKQVFLGFITTFGLLDSPAHQDVIQHSLTMDVLFE